MPAAPLQTRAAARSSARLAAVQALYQREMQNTEIGPLLNEWHEHRLGIAIDDERLAPAETGFFDDVVRGVAARCEEIDALVSAHLASGWTLDRLDRPTRAILRAGVYELIARPDIPPRAVINEYVEVAHAFHAAREAGFVNGLLDAVAKRVRPAA